MGFHVGIPTLKLSRKVAANASRKRTGTLRSVACEALEERWSRDPDIDHTLTQYNEYEGIRSGLALVEAMSREVEEYSQKRREAGGRAVRDTASIGFVTIVKPDMDAVNSMTPDERKRFFADSREILDDILGRDNVRARVIHRDEQAEHEHTFRMGYMKDGTLCVDKLVCPDVWRKVNLEYPRKMREKGWEVDDCEMYDAEKAKEDPAYKRERIERKKQYGRGSSKFKADRDKAALAEQSEALDTRQAVRQADLDTQADFDAAVDAQAEYDRAAKQEILDAQAERQGRALQRISQEQVQVNSGRKQNDAVKAALSAREAVLNTRANQIYQAAVQAAQAYLEGIEADKRRTAEEQAAAEEEARKAGEEAIQAAINIAGGIPQRPGQQWQQRGPGLG